MLNSPAWIVPLFKDKAGRDAPQLISRNSYKPIDRRFNNGGINGAPLHQIRKLVPLGPLLA
jgi:hypothetical protein